MEMELEDTEELQSKSIVSIEQVPIHSFEDILRLIKPFGLWQAWVYFWALIYTAIMGMTHFSFVFLLITPPFICDEPHSANMTSLAQVPDHLLNSCVDSMGFKCTQFRYFMTNMRTTIVTEWDLVCDKSLYIQHSQLIYWAGITLGLLSAGQFADKFGRKTVIVVAQLTLTLFAMLSCFATSYWSFVIFRAILALSMGCIWVPTFALGSEITTAKWRSWIGGGFWAPYSIGTTVLAAIAYGYREWRPTLLTITIPFFLSLVNWWLLPESPRWLLVEGNVKRGEKVLRWAAKWNGVKLPADIDFEAISKIISSEAQQTKAHGLNVFHLLRHRKMFVRVFVTFYCWFAVSLVFFGVSMKAILLPADAFVTNALIAFVEIPGFLSAPFLLNFIGRRVPYSVIMLCCGIVLIIMPWIPYSVMPLIIVLALLGKMAAACSWGIIYVYSAEIYPTVLRTASMCVTAFGAGIGAMISPYIADIGKIVSRPPHAMRTRAALSNANLGWLSMIIMGALALPAAAFIMIPPETKGRRMPDHLEDVIGPNKFRRGVEMKLLNDERVNK